jgi:hypothetical protein
VHLRGDRVIAFVSEVAPEMPERITPEVGELDAVAAAELAVRKYYPSEDPDWHPVVTRLEILNRGLLDDQPSDSRLVWLVELDGDRLREFVWIDAVTGDVLLHFNQLPTARSRNTYTASNMTSLPGTLLRAEGAAAVGDTDADLAHDYAGDTYDFFQSSFGRDSFDGAGATITQTVHYCTGGCAFFYRNAFWDGVQIVYGEGLSRADDVVAHELTHAVTQYEADLFYYQQSGALNESFSDIFGEAVDLLNGRGNDGSARRWYIGEDVPVSVSGGPIRHMMNPQLYGDPAKISDPQFLCDPNIDGGGLHVNSGVPNHAFALMVDGGAYNGRTVQGIGLTKAVLIEYRALSEYMTSGANFSDAFNALNQACVDLVGTSGITTTHCSNVRTALEAVELHARIPCSEAATIPSMCPSGTTPTPVFADGFEAPSSSWSVSMTGSGQWFTSVAGWAKTGLRSAYGQDVGSISDHRLTMTSGVSLPPGARLQFDHAFGFERFGGINYDGGVLEYSVDGGASWIDAEPLIVAGHGYGGFLSPSNSLGVRRAFVSTTFGYTSTQLDLGSLSGSAVRFRFRIGTDWSVGHEGWSIDNFRVYTCSSCTYTLSAQRQSFGPTGGTRLVSVSTPSECAWSVSAGPSWIAMAASPGSGEGTVALTAAPNPSATPRTATITIGSQTVWLVQAGPGRSRSRLDFDGDGAADLAVFRPGTGDWWMLDSSSSRQTYLRKGWGTAGDVPVPGDYDGDGLADLAVWRHSTGDWWILTSTSGYASYLRKGWGDTNFVPVPGDYDGDGRTDIAVWRPSTGVWWILTSSTNFQSYFAKGWGDASFIPVPGDYDGDGRTDLAVWNQASGMWWILRSSSGFESYFTAGWGGTDFVPVPGDYDGDRRTDIAVWRPLTGVWWILTSSSGYSSYFTRGWGDASFTPVAADYDGDRRTDIAVWRPSTGVWWMLTSASDFSSYFTQGWGDAADVVIR